LAFLNFPFMGNPTLSKVEGCLIGTALGDGLGEYPYIWDSDKPIPPTDDTVMTLALAEVLFKNGQYDPQKVAEKYFELYKEGTLTKIGYTTLKALERFEKTKNWFYSGVIGERAAGNGVAMRIAPLGIFAFLKKVPIEDFYEWVRWEGYITHRNELAIEGAFAVALGVFFALNELPKEEIYRKTLTLLKDFGMESPLKWNLSQIPNLLKEATEKALPTLGTSGYVVHTVASAFYLFLKEEDFLEGLRKLVKVGGDTDTVGAIYGALYGSYYGSGKFPNRLVERLEIKPQVDRFVGILKNFFEC